MFGFVKAPTDQSIRDWNGRFATGDNKSDRTFGIEE
jgi:hypothetical protein